MNERIKDYRRLNLHFQNYFRGNTASRCARIRKIQKRIFAKRLRQGLFLFMSIIDKGTI